MNVRNKRGQVIIMVTLVLIVMCGMLGLAVDLGWSFYVRKAAVAATDAAALAAVTDAHSFVGGGTYTCGPHVTCQPTPTTCSNSIPSPPGGSNNLDNGCLYAQKLTYGTGSSGTWDNIMMSAEVPASTSACQGIGIWPNGPAGEQVCVHYWATARAYENIPQLFSAVLGNTWGGSSARSTAAVVDAVVPGSLYALNREGDPGYNPPGGAGGANFDPGVGVTLTGDSEIEAGGGVFIASQADGAAKKSNYAAESTGNAMLTGSSINIYGGGAVDDIDNFDPDPVNNNNFSLFDDPMSGKGQPKAPTSGQAPDRPIALGQIDGSADCDNPLIMPPGSYYATDLATGAPTGNPIRVTGCVTFSAGSNTTWGDYVFFGGLHFTATHTTATFGPGRYFVAGAKGADPVFQMVTGVTLKDMTPVDGNGNSLPPINQGEVFVFTNTEYPELYVPPALENSGIAGQLGFGWVDIQTGNNAESGMNLHGLNRDSSLPDGLREFAPALFWWDQQNSLIQYDSNGNVVYKNNNPADPVLNDPNAVDPFKVDPFLRLLAGTNTDLWGLIYQPRGAYMDFQGNPDVLSPVRIITGAISLGGTSSILMSPTAPFAYVTKIALIE